MICINCFNHDTRVTNSRPHKKSAGIWRRRRCPACTHAFTTYEKPAMDGRKPVLGPDGPVSFSLSKLTLSIAASFAHDHTARERYSLDLAETVEQLLITDTPQPSTDDIAAATHAVLKRFDELAALHYAASHGLVEATRKRRGRPSVR